MEDIDPLAQSASDYLPQPTTIVERPVPNLFPRITNVPYRLAIVGEAPGKDEVEQGKPFVGHSGRDLDRYLSRFSLVRDACFIGNICQQRPPNNEIARFDWDGPEIQGGLQKLAEDLATFRPHAILLLGGSALHAFKDPLTIPKRKKTDEGMTFGFPNSISDWRGSFFESHFNSPSPRTKCMATFHPAACMRQYKFTPYLLLDVGRIAKQATFPELNLPVRNLRVGLSFDETVTELEKLLLCSDSFGTDIEGYWNYFRCVSFSPTPTEGFIVPFIKMNGESYWSLDQECILMRLMARVLERPQCNKVWQNGLYDRFCFQYGLGIVCRGHNDDIMLMHWENHCEFKKELGVQASIYTDEPYWKSDIGSNDEDTFHRYCCKDSAVTKEIATKVPRYLNPTSWAHYQFNRTLLNPLLYMELRGLRYDTAKVKQRVKELNEAIWERQYDLDQIAGKGLRTTDKTVLRAILRDVMCYKKDSSKVKAEFTEVFDINMRTLLGEGELTKAQLGRLNMDLKQHLNVDSSKQLGEYLYKTLGLPTQYHPTTGSPTCNYEALLKLKKKSSHPSLPIIIDMTELLTRSSMLKIQADPDGRIRSSYNEVGSETGRVSSSTSPTGSGYNLQTLPDENDLKPPTHPLHRGMRDLVIADEGHFLAKCDLKGADGWTIAANLASLGDCTMLDDLRFGLKPAHFPCYVRRRGMDSIRGKSREELAALFKEIKKSDWDYFAAKQCTWGFCYNMGLTKAVNHVHNVSEGTVTVTEADMEVFKSVIFRRYNVPLWHKAVEHRLFNQPYPPKLLSPSGHLREFWDRKTEILGQALAHEPQSVTTYVTNLAVYKCWTDPENRTKVGLRTKLRVEPMHQVHDEAVFQFRKEDISWALAKIKQWFNNTITIAGIKLVVPFEGAYGTNWAMDSESKVGDIK